MKTAIKLTPGVNFKMGGIVQHITQVEINWLGDVILRFHPIGKKSRYSSILIVPRNTVFKIYPSK